MPTLHIQYGQLLKVGPIFCPKHNHVDILSSDQSLPSDIPSAVSIRALFRRHVDFLAVPRRSFFQMLRYFTTSDVEAERLDEFLSPESAVRTITLRL